jgi:hypothetical protein
MCVWVCVSCVYLFTVGTSTSNLKKHVKKYHNALFTTESIGNKNSITNKNNNNNNNNNDNNNNYNNMNLHCQDGKQEDPYSTPAKSTTVSDVLILPDSRKRKQQSMSAIAFDHESDVLMTAPPNVY